ncbi:hypothetical protein P3T24_005378 [Paraburkholderia sp. GAS33]
MWVGTRCSSRTRLASLNSCPLRVGRGVALSFILRKDVNVSQSVFAIYLNTAVSTVRKWEQGDKNLSGIAARMLQLVQKNGLEIFG